MSPEPSLTIIKPSEEEGAAAPAIFGDHQEKRAERLYQKITGQATIPSDHYVKAIHDLIAVLDHYPGQEPPTVEGRAVFVRWCSTTGQKGKTYSRTNPGWIGWWLEELAPVPVEVRTKDTSDMSDAEFRAMLQKGAIE